MRVPGQDFKDKVVIVTGVQSGQVASSAMQLGGSSNLGETIQIYDSVIVAMGKQLMY